MSNLKIRSVAFCCWLTLAGLLSASIAEGQTRWRVSVKFLLDEQGNRPATGNVISDTDILDQVALANEILDQTGAFQLELVEILDITVAREDVDCSERDQFEAAAKLSPTAFAWRDDAINVYVSHSGCAGVCSFPADGTDTIILGQGARTTTMLHEIGHFMSLCHTQGCPCGSCGETLFECNSIPGTDNIADTLPDLECWDQNDIAQHSFSQNYASLTNSQRQRVDAVFKNVMSYHAVRDRLTLGQIERMREASDGPRANVLADCPRTIRGQADPGDHLGTAIATGDFNGDGFDDQALGVPGESRALRVSFGVVNVIYGSPRGPAVTGNQMWDQAPNGSVESGDRFGAALACGDFNGDSFDDLAIGVPEENIDAIEDAGAVSILYGSAAGLTALRSHVLHQGLDFIPGEAEAGDRFGSTLAVGDFDRDGIQDLAVGVAGENSGAGVVIVLFGSPAGVSTRSQLWHQDLDGVKGVMAASDAFGAAMAAGDFDGDLTEDLAIGAPGEDFGAGEVLVLFGAPGIGLTNRDELWDQDSTGVPGHVEAGDRFGAALTTGDFDGDGFTDLAIGVPQEDIEAIPNGGAVDVLYGSTTGLAGRDQWHQDTLEVPGGVEDGDLFGYSVVARDFDGDGLDDLAIGVPGEDVSSFLTLHAGAVNVLYGSATGLSVAHAPALFHQDSLNVPGHAEPGDSFGASLAAGDLDGNGRADLIVGIPCENLNSVDDAGAAVVLFGRGPGLTTTGSQVWHQDRIVETGCPLITVRSLSSPGLASIVISEAMPYSPVAVAYSMTGGGPYRTNFGYCLLSPPLLVLGTGMTNNVGFATLTLPVPDGLVGQSLWLQGFDVAARRFTNGLSEVIGNGVPQ